MLELCVINQSYRKVNYCFCLLFGLLVKKFGYTFKFILSNLKYEFCNRVLILWQLNSNLNLNINWVTYSLSES